MGCWVLSGMPVISETGRSDWGEGKSLGSEMYWRTVSHSALSMVGGRQEVRGGGERGEAGEGLDRLWGQI